MSRVLTERLIQRQLNHWNRLRTLLREQPASAPPRRRPVMTVSRLAASGGRSLATALAQRLDLELHDHSLITTIARDRELEASLVAQLDERTVSQTRLWVQGLLQGRLFLRDDFHQALVRVIGELAARGGVVFLGRGANLVLGERADLRVRVVGSVRRRTERLRERTGLAPEEAHRLLLATDLSRARFVREVFRTEPGSPENYDLVLNSDRLDEETMVDHVLLALSQRLAEPRPALQGQA
ncbi:MAG: AAA family ATPase [Candidatus Krumholzibacteriia bacterium]